MGVFKNPFVVDQRGDWTQNWRFIETSSSTLTEWVKMLHNQSNTGVIKYFNNYKKSLSDFSTNLRLEDHRFWHHERRDGEYIQHLLMQVKMLNIAFQMAYSAIFALWHHLLRTQADFSRLIEKVIQK